MKKMFISLCLIVGSVLLLTSASRRGRSVLQLDGMVTCLTNHSAIYDYFYYGCWCGYGGSGEPVDDADQCCKTHDECYDNLVTVGVCNATDLYEKEYLIYYDDCLTSSAYVLCGPGDDCQVGLCNCDLGIALCFREAAYNPAFNYFDRDNFCFSLSDYSA